MIEKYFASKRKPKVYQHQPFNQPQWQGSNFTETAKAHKLGITLDQYRERVILVAKAAQKNKWRIGDVGFPCTQEGAREHGECRVVGIVTHYDNYGNVDWNDPPFIMSVTPVYGDSGGIISCTSGWLVDKSPLVSEC